MFVVVGLNVSFDACTCSMFRALVKSSLAPAICLLAKITGLGRHFDLHGHALLCSNPLTPAPWPLSAVVIWWMALQTWLLIAVTLERFSLAEGTALASTCMPTVRRQPLAGSSVLPGLLSPLLELVLVAAGEGLVAGKMAKPRGEGGCRKGPRHSLSLGWHPHPQSQTPQGSRHQGGCWSPAA